MSDWTKERIEKEVAICEAADKEFRQMGGGDQPGPAEIAADRTSIALYHSCLRALAAALEENARLRAESASAYAEYKRISDDDDATIAELEADIARLREELDLRWNDLSNIQLLLSSPGGVSLDDIAGLAVALDRTLETRKAKERT